MYHNFLCVILLIKYQEISYFSFRTVTASDHTDMQMPVKAECRIGIKALKHWERAENYLLDCATREGVRAFGVG